MPLQRDNTVITIYILQAGFLPSDWVGDDGVEKSSAKDLFMDSQTKLATTEAITKLRSGLMEFARGRRVRWVDDLDMGVDGEDESCCFKNSNNEDEHE